MKASNKTELSEKNRKTQVKVSDSDVARGHNALKAALTDDRRSFGIHQTPNKQTVAKRLIFSELKGV